MTNNMTSGSPIRLIIMMSIPIILANLFQQMYTMADTIIVGRYLGDNALGAVGSTSSIYNMVLWFASGIASGFAILISHSFGCNDYEQMRNRVCHSVILLSLIGVLVTVLSLVCIEQFLYLMRTPKEMMADAVAYIKTILSGIIATLAYNMCSAILRAFGDSRTPLIFLILTSVLNVILDILLVVKMGTAGAALATVISQAVSAILCIIYMYKKLEILHMKRQNWIMNKKMSINMLKLGVPMGIMGALTASGVIVLQFAVNSFGAAAVSAYTAASRIEYFFSQPMSAYAVTMSNYVGQNYGAGKYQRIKTGVRQCTVLMLVTAIIGGLLLNIFGKYFASVLIEDVSSKVFEYATQYLSIVGCSLWAFGIICVYRSSVQGMGEAGIPTINAIIESSCRVIWTIWLVKYGNFHQLCFANPVTWFIASIILIILYKRKMQSLLKDIDN